MKGLMTEKKRTRVEELEQFCRLVTRDMNNFVDQLNRLGNILQATVNVLGPGAVQNEMARLASPEPSTPPVSEEQKAATDANGSPVEEPGADEAEDRPAQSP